MNLRLWLVPEEVIATLAVLEPRHTVTYGQLRYWDDEGIVPASRVHDRGARLYGPDDVAMIRLALRVLASGRTLRQVSEALRYRGAEIRDAFHAGRALVLTFGPRGVAEVLAAAAVPDDADAYDLRPCARGVIDAMRAQRREQPHIWTGFRFERPSLVEAAVLT